MEVQDWSQEALSAYSKKDFVGLKNLFDILFNYCNPPPKILKSKGSSKLGNVFVEIINMAVQWKIMTNKEGGEFKSFQKYIGILLQIRQSLQLFDQPSSLWFLQVAKGLLRRTKKMFKRAKLNGLQTGQKMDKYLQKIVNTLREYSIKFNMMKQSDAIQAKVKKTIEPLTVNLLISLHLSTLDYHFCQKKIKTKSKVNPDNFPLEDRNIYYFNEGRILLVGCDPVNAQIAFDKIKCDQPRMSLLLKYAVPCKLFLGKFPQNSFLIANKLTQFIGIIKALRNGDIKLFNQQTNRFNTHWIKRGLYIYMNKLKAICYRNLVKSVHKLLGGPDRIALELLHKAFVFSEGATNNQITVQEVGCLIANLVCLGLVKGYIFHGQTKKLLMLKREGAFPKIKQSLKLSQQSLFV